MASLVKHANDDSRDALTGLADIEFARRQIAEWQESWPDTEHGCPLHAMLIVPGRIETLNVAFGETAGDGALVEVAHRIRHFAADELESSVWLAARISGGSFLLVAREECSRERWQWLAEALADAVAMPISNPGGEGSIRLSPRLVLLRASKNDTPASMLDTLAEGARKLRDNPSRRIAWSSGELARAGRTHHELEADLLTAIDRDEIEVVFQPQYSVATGSLVGAEALARWHHPVLGRIGAGTLFTIAERADHVTQLTRHIAHRALLSAARWPDGLQLSLNVTPADLSASSFYRDFLAMVADSDFDAHRITLEITEQVLLSDLEQVSEMLGELREQGISLALDDFGAGFCNFHYLKVLPLDRIKLDQSMVHDVMDDERDLAVFRAIIAMAKALDLKVTAEGIEAHEQLELIAAEGCDVWQGFLRSHPMPCDEFLTLAMG